MEEDNQLDSIGLVSPMSTTAPTSSVPTVPSSNGTTSPTTITNTSVDDSIQLEPSEEELERERLIARAEQLQDEIQELRNRLYEKEIELGRVKDQLGITTLTELREGMSQGWKVIGNKWKDLQETSAFRKIDSTLSGWKNKLEESERYQKTKSSLNEGGKKVSTSISSAATNVKDSEAYKNMSTKTSSALQRTGTAIRSTGTAIRENETMQNVGGRIRSTSVRVKERIMGNSVDVQDHTEGEEESTSKETLVPDEPPAKD